MNLGVDPRHADQNVRGAIALPHGTGQDVRVHRVRQGRQGDRGARGRGRRGRRRGARQEDPGRLAEFDRVIATPDMMSVVGRLGRVLGPRGLMPNPKVGTVTFRTWAAPSPSRRPARSSSASTRTGSSTCPFGKASFEPRSSVREPAGDRGRGPEGEAADVQGHLPEEDVDLDDDGPGDPLDTATCRRRSPKLDRDEAAC